MKIEIENKEIRTEDGRVFSPFCIVRHFKGKYYMVLDLDTTHTETGEPLIIYRALYGDNKVYARPKEMFLSEVDHNKYPLEKTKYRLTPITSLIKEMGKHEFIKQLVRDEEENNESYDILHIEGSIC